MKTHFALSLFLLTGSLLHADNAETAASIKFSDPSKPESVKIYIEHGDLRVTVGTTPDTVTVKSDAQVENSDAKRPDGLRVLSSATGFSLSEKENVVELTYGQGIPGGTSGADFEVTVPKSVSLEITNGWGGDIYVEAVSGDVAIKSMNGEIKLEGLGGGALVETMNGEINASLATFAGKPLSFTSMNGEINLHLPAAAKANVRFRTQNGSILTDFDEALLKTKTEPTAENGHVQTEIARHAAEAARAIAQEAERTARELANEDRIASAEDSADAKSDHPTIGPRPPRPPRPPSIPALSGGKVVSGTLNGGGSDIQATTMNGDIVVRQLKSDKK